MTLLPKIIHPRYRVNVMCKARTILQQNATSIKPLYLSLITKLP